MFDDVDGLNEEVSFQLVIFLFNSIIKRFSN
jgi:hypothetical protein